MSLPLHAPRTTVVIRMLGSFQILAYGQPIPPARFGSRKARILLRWLADSRNDVVPEDVLLEALWPDTPPSAAVRSFRVRVSELRKMLSTFISEEDASNLLERVDNGYRLRTVPGLFSTDADMFHDAAEKAMGATSLTDALPLLRRAAELYGGDYFSDDPYTEQWQPARERYRQRFAEVTARLADAYESDGRYEEGIRLLQRLLTQPVREEGHYRRLMRLQYSSGDQSGALRTFEQCREYLQSEFDAQPMPQTLELLKRITRREPLQRPKFEEVKTESTPTVSPSPARRQWPFLGREAELARLGHKMRALTEARGAAVWIYGPSGIGKSRLLEEALAAAGAAPFRSLRLQGSSLNSGIPFAALLDGLQTGLKPKLTAVEIDRLPAGAPELRRLLGLASEGDSPTTGAEEPGRFRDIRLRQQFLHLFEALTGETPLVLVLDEPGALDTATAALLAALARRVNQWPLLIAVTAVDEPDRDELGTELLSMNPPCSVIPVGPLAVDDLLPLMKDGTSGATARDWLVGLHRDTGGEPRMLTDVLTHLQGSHLLDFQDGRIVFPSGLLKLITDEGLIAAVVEGQPRRDDAFTQHWQRVLDTADRELLQKAAALGDFLTWERLQSLSDAGDEAFRRRLEGLLRQGFLTLGRGAPGLDMKLAFADARLRLRTYQTMSDAERIWYNRRILELLQTEAEELYAGKDPEDDTSPVARTRLYAAVAFHALRAERWEDAAHWCLKAARWAKRITPGLEVVALARQAYEAASRAPGRRDLLEEAEQLFADALFHVGSYEEALPLHEQLAHSNRGDKTEIAERLVRMYLHFQRIDAAHAVAKGMLAAAADDMRARAHAQLQLADISYRRGQVVQAVARGRRALRHFRDAADDGGRLQAHRRMGLFYWDLGEYGQAIDHSKALIDGKPVSVQQTIHGLNQLGEMYQDIFCTAIAQRLHRKAFALAQQHGRIVLGIEISRNIGLNFVLAGRLDEGLELLEQAWRNAQDLNVEPYRKEIHLRSLLEATLWAHRPREVRDLLRRYRDEVGPRETPFIAVFTLALALLEGRLDEGEAMLAQVQDFWDKTGRRAKAAHVLLFAGEELILRGHQQRGQSYLAAALREMERICSLVPADVARHIRGSRQYRTAKTHRGPLTGRTG